MKKFLLTFTIVALLTGCGSQTESPDTKKETPEVEEVYVFESKGNQVTLGDKADNVISTLGEPLDKFEEKSCAFNGWDKIYYYAGFELHTSLPEGQEETVASIVFIDDSVSTKEGISIGSTLAQIEAAYGKEYTQTDGQYVYTKGNTKLSFILENEKVVLIEYVLA